MKHWNITIRLLRSCCIALSALYLLVPVSQSWGDPNVPRQLPFVGIPYASMTDGGKMFLGSVEIYSFESTGDGLVAVGILYEKKKAHEVTVTVHLNREDCWAGPSGAGCWYFGIELGPPDGKGIPRLVDPLTISIGQHPYDTQAGISDIGLLHEALDDGTWGDVAQLLNEVVYWGGDELASCPWYTKAACEFPITVCGTRCLDSTEVRCDCLHHCFVSLGVSKCWYCTSCD